MDHFGGLDVSVKETSICIVDDTGRIVKEVKVASEPEALLKVLGNPILSAASQRAGRWYLHLKPAAGPHTCDAANFCFRSLALDIAGCSVKADARGMDLRITPVGPIDETRHRFQQGLA